MVVHPSHPPSLPPSQVYPLDHDAKAGISKAVPVRTGEGDAVYLPALRRALDEAAADFGRPDLVLWNAGSDPLVGDPLGLLAVSREGMLERDRLVMDFARRRLKAPVCWCLSGGYQDNNAGLIAER